jgi:TolB-like protein
VVTAAVAIVAAVALTYVLTDKFWLLRHTKAEQAVAPAAPSLPAPAISEKSIAVLPFVDMSEKQDQEYFADGMAEEILNQLVKVPELKVIGRTSSFQFKGKTDDLRKIGLSLGAAYVVEGSVRRSGNHVRVTAQLIDTHNGVHRWSDTYDRATSDVIEVQNEIALNLVRALEIEVAPSILGARAPKSDEAYDSLLRGLHALDRLDEAGFNEAAAHFRHALEIDPAYLPAAEGVAAALYGLVDANYVDQKVGYEQARTAADAALKLDSKSVSAHAVLGLIHVQYDFDWPGAAREFKEALAVAPHDPFVLVGATEERIAVGQWDEAVRISDTAIATDPLEANLYRLRSYAYLRLGRSAEAESGFRRAMEISPTYSWAHYFLGMALLSKNENEAALVEMQKETIREASDAGAVVAYVELRRPEDARRALARLQADASSRWPFGLAVAYAALGRNTEAFAWLDRAYVARDSSLWAIKGHPFFKNLFSDPRYTTLLRKMNLPE